MSVVYLNVMSARCQMYMISQLLLLMSDVKLSALSCLG